MDVVYELISCWIFGVEWYTPKYNRLGFCLDPIREPVFFSRLEQVYEAVIGKAGRAVSPVAV